MKTKYVVRQFLTVSLLLCSAVLPAQEGDFVGDWTIITTGFSFVGSTSSYVEVTIEERDGALEAYVYNGPVPLRVDGNSFELDIDWRSGFDVEYLSTFRGTLGDDGTLAGELTHHGATTFLGRSWQDGKFTGSRAAARPDLDGLPPLPVDLSGIWNRASGQGAVSKIRFAMTDQGQATLDNYLEMDNANSRLALSHGDSA